MVAIEQRSGRSAPRKTPLQIIEEKYIPEPNSGCWLWTGSDDGGQGYGRVTPSLLHNHYQAHRLSYEVHVGPIPDGLVLDHLCRTPACVNPAHLEPVTAIENMRRGNYLAGLALGGVASGEKQKSKTHCPHGHAYTPENLRASKGGHRRCKTCHRNRERARRQSLIEECPENF